MRSLVIAALREERFENVVLTGDGPIRAERGARDAIARTNPEAVIGIGIAGGVASELRRGDVVVAKTIVDEDGHVHDCDARLVGAAADCGATPVTLATVRATVFDKRSIAAAAVDMESAAWQRAARDLPFVAVRVILDPHDEQLPSFLAKCARPDGSISRVRVALRALVHPRAIVRLARDAAAARTTLRRFLPKLLAKVAAIPYDR